MKRRYKAGDWFRIALDGEKHAVGVITRSCRSRLFGYFFPIAAHDVATNAMLASLRADAALHCALFGAAPIEQARWKVVATSVAFDEAAWPFPQFALRGAFGRTWTRRAYDPETLQACDAQAIDRATGAELPDARFAGAAEVEQILRGRFNGRPERPVQSTYAARVPIDLAYLDALAPAVVHLRTPVQRAVLDALAPHIASHPDTRLCIGGREPFDVRALAGLVQLRALDLDADEVVHAEELRNVPALRELRIRTRRPIALDALAHLRDLRALALHGIGADVLAAAHCKGLESLTLIGTPPLDVSQAPVALRSLTLAFGKHDLSPIARLDQLQRLELRGMQLPELPDLSRNAALTTIVLREVALLRDLAPLASASALIDLHIEGMAQLSVWDFEPLRSRPDLSSLSVDVGSRKKSREIYRMLGI